MSDSQHSSDDLSFDDNFRQELIQMWQDETYSKPADPGHVTRQFALSLKKLDGRILGRNIVEYGAAVIVIVRSLFEISSGERLLFVPLTSIAVAIFIGTYIWRRHRASKRPDPTADASAYRTALLDRLDGQLHLIRGVRYWYVLPCWIFFLAVLTSGVLKGLPFLPLLGEFFFASALCVVVIWLNEKYGARRLAAERERVHNHQKEGLMSLVDVHPGTTLAWVQPHMLKMNYELRAGDDVIATLRFTSLFGSYATAESSDGCWTFKRVGFLQTRATVRACGSDAEIAKFRDNTWKGGGTLELSDGRKFLATTNLWMTQFEFQDAPGQTVFHMKRHGTLRTSLTVELQPGALSVPETSWMVMFAGYVVVWREIQG